jgi:hypothetical protein
VCSAVRSLMAVQQLQPPACKRGHIPSIHLSECGFLLRPQPGQFPIPPHLSGIDPFRSLSHEGGGPLARYSAQIGGEQKTN